MSSTHFSHAELQERLPAYLAYELDPEEREAVAVHLMSCAECRAELEEMRQVMTLLAKLGPRSVANPSNVDTVMTMLAARSSQVMAPASWISPPSRPSLHERTYDDEPSEQMQRMGVHSPMRMPPEPRHTVRSFVTIVATVIVVGLIAALLASRLVPSGPAAPPSSVGDWSAAYWGSDGRLHIVSATGKSRIGPILPGANANGYLMSSRSGISADGRYLAYIQWAAGDGSGPVTVVDLTNGQVTTLDLMATELHWAPDAPRFFSVLSTNTSLSFTVTDMRTNQSQAVPLGHAFDLTNEIRLLGWIDAQHVAIVANRDDKSLTVSLMSLDLITGGTRNLASLVEAPDVYLSPDGKLVFIAPNYSSPSAQVVDTTTGSTHELPGITVAFAGHFKHLDNINQVYGGNWAYQWTWQPGTHTIALSLSAASIPDEGGTQPTTQDAGVWLIDLDHDQATNITHNNYPLGWTPDGRALFVSDIIAPSMSTNTGYFVGPQLSVISPVMPSEKSQLLAQNMLAFFGLVHTQ
jgi:Putative zinc-finger